MAADTIPWTLLLEWLPPLIVWTFAWHALWSRLHNSKPAEVASHQSKSFPLFPFLLLCQNLASIYNLQNKDLFDVAEIATDANRNQINGAPTALLSFWWVSVIKFTQIFWAQGLKVDQVPPVLYSHLIISAISAVVASCRKNISTSHPRKENNCPEREASLLSKLFFFWVLDLKGWKQKLKASDLWHPEVENSSKHLTASFNAVFYSQEGPQSVTLFSAIFRLLWKLLFVVGVYQILEQVCSFGATHLFKLLIGSSSGTGDVNVASTFIYLAAMFIVSTVKTIVSNHGSYQMGIATIRARSYITNSLYNKAVRIANYRRNESSMGEIVNMMTGDCGAIERFFSCIHLSWSIPLNVIVSVYFQWQLLGSSVLAGLCIMAILMILNVLTGNLSKSLTQREIVDRSRRITLMAEVLGVIQEIKLYTLQKVFSSRIETLRNQEMRSILKSALINVGLNFCWSFSLFLISLATFLTYVWIDENNVLDAQKVFVYLALVNSMTGVMKSFPAVVGTIIQVKISLQRVQNFLVAEDAVAMDESTLKALRNNDAVHIRNGCFKLESFELRNINLTVRKGSLVALIGKSGSGKSSMLAAMNRSSHVTQTGGDAWLDGETCLLTQSPFILDDTIEYNILFGLEMRRGRYEQVVNACALHPDFDSFLDQDQTRAGNKGNNLSGGQRQRIALARTLYRDADIYFLDNPLSAVDGQVAVEVFKKAIGRNGLLGCKTRVVVATNLRGLDDADQIYVMSEGQIIRNGTFQEISEWELTVEKGILVESNPEKNATKVTDENTQPRRIDVTKNVKSKPKPIPNIEPKQKRKQEIKKLLDPDHENVLASKWKFLPYYLSKCSWLLVFCIFITHLAQQGFGLASNHWLSKATSGTESMQNHETRNKNFSIYVLLGLSQGFFHACASIFLTFATLHASASLHNMMLRSSLGAKMGFYHKNNTASILEYFSREIGDMDKLMGNRFVAWLSCAFTVVSTVALILSYRPLFIAVVIPLALAYVLLLKYYRAKIMQLTNLDVWTRAPIYAQFNESLLGMETIRVLKAEQSFCSKFQERVDSNISCYYAGLVGMRFHAVCLDMLGNIFVFFTALFVVCGTEDNMPGLLGVLLGYAFQVTGSLNSLIVVTSTLEGGLAVVQRIQEFEDLPQEDGGDDLSNAPLAASKINGEIMFNHFGTRYAEDLDPVLERVTEIVHPKEKIGIVGRTGSGKSSLMLSLVRILDADTGSIEIDGVDITQIRIKDLRKIVTVVAQDPVIYSGTVRFNLDPLGERNTESIWEVLERVSLKSFIENFPNGLDYSLVPNDPAFSFGQQQLLAFARATLRNTPILIFDEATSAMDKETERVITDLILRGFKESTLIIIAHRLKTIMECTRVMVIRDKTVSECSTLQTLLQNPRSDFYKMVNFAADSKIKN